MSCDCDCFACAFFFSSVVHVTFERRFDVAPLRLAGLDVVLSRHFQRRLHRLGPAGDEVGVIERSGRQVGEPLAQSLGRLGGEKGGVGIGELVDLGMDRGGDGGWPCPRQLTAAPPEPSM